MTRQTTASLRNIPMNATNRTVVDLAHGVQRGDITLDAPYQRGHIWTVDQRIALIRSWLQGIPVAAAILNNRMGRGWPVAGPAYAVVDGKQRITTAIMWLDDEFAVPASWFDPRWVDTTVDTDDGPYVHHSNLSVVGQRMFATRAMLPCAEAQVSSVAAEAEVYLLVNGEGTPQTDADMVNARRVAEGH